MRQIDVCLNCPLPECMEIDNIDCHLFRKGASRTNEIATRTQRHLNLINEMLPHYGYSLPLVVMMRELKISRMHVNILKKRGLIKTKAINRRLIITEVLNEATIT